MAPRDDGGGSLPTGLANEALADAGVDTGRIREGLRHRLFGDEPAFSQPTLGGPTDSDARAPGLALAKGAVVGRYVVVSRLGTGGMGVVYAAYDPELDRKVALKLLRPDASGRTDPGSGNGNRDFEARTRLLREAQALAKLSHPNVVTVHDVGEHEGLVWLAMEHIEGATLSTWEKAAPRTWRAVLEVMTAAGRGLAAAHAAELLHRDFKPDNVMVGADGRVRVMDLGLARATGAAREPELSSDADTTGVPEPGALALRLTRVGAVMGTPAYMAPEQLTGVDVDARADVFAYCVTLWEALYGERPFAGETFTELAANVLEGTSRPPPTGARVPRWLRKACLRGLAVDPDRRFASMEALLDAVARGRARARVREVALVLGGIAVLAAGGESYRRYDLEREAAQKVLACETEGRESVAAWNDEARAQVRAGLLATKAGYAETTADKVMPWLDRHADALESATTEACLDARVDDRLTPDELEKIHWCLDESRLQLSALVSELGRADATVLQQALTAAAGLSPPAACTDRRTLGKLPERPPVELRAAAAEIHGQAARASALRAAGKYDEGLTVARAALVEAEALSWPPLTAAIRQLEASLLESTGAYAEAESTGQAAYIEAAKAGAWHVASSAASRLAYVVGCRQARVGEGLTWAGHAEVAAQHAGDPFGLHEAARLGNLGNVQETAGAFAEAKSLHARALALWEDALGEDHPDVALSLNYLANAHAAAGEYAEARALHERVLAIWENALGKDHPHVAGSLTNLATVRSYSGEYAEAKALHERALAIWENALGKDHPDVALSLNNLATVHARTGDYDGAKPLFERALAIRERAFGKDHLEVAQSLTNLANVAYMRGDYAEARALHERALAIREKALGKDHAQIAHSLVNLAAVLLAVGADAEAKAHHERALAIWEKALGPDAPLVAVPLTSLAKLAMSQGRTSEALVAASRALQVRERGGVPPEHLAESRFLLATLLWEAHGKSRDRSRALVLAAQARDGYRDAPGHEATAAAVDAWLREHGGAR